MNREAWWPTVHGVTKSRTLKRLSMRACIDHATQPFELHRLLDDV